MIPTEAEAGFDVRITPNLAPKDFQALLDKWCEEEGGLSGVIKTSKTGVSWQYAPWTRPLQEHFTTATDDSNCWWVAFQEAMTSTLSENAALCAMPRMGHKVEPEVFPAATDSRFLRELHIPALGFSPMTL